MHHTAAPLILHKWPFPGLVGEGGKVLLSVQGHWRTLQMLQLHSSGPDTTALKAPCHITLFGM